MPPRRTATQPRLPEHETLDELPEGELEDREDYAGLNLANQRFGSVDGVSLSGVRLKEIDWSGAFLRRLDLNDALLATCNVANAKWEHAGMLRVVLDSCQLTGLGLKASTFKHVVFRGCQGRFLHFEGCNLQGARFERCVLTEASFERCDLTGVVFVECDLHHAAFAGSRLHGADFRRANVEASRVGAAELAGAVLAPLQALSLFERYTGARVEAE